MRLIISGGGTGGHVYPALAVVQSLKQQCEAANRPLDLRWVGSRGGMEQALVERAGLTIELISAVGLRGKNPLAALKSLMTLAQGYRHSRQILRQFQPQALFVTGGYVCVPITLAAWRANIPVIIYLPDIEPGLAIKFLARFARRVAVTAAESQRFFKPGQSVVTGYPVRPALQFQGNRQARQVAARRQLQLDDSLPLLLVFGGSRGARSINRAVGNHIEHYLAHSQVLHITGTLDEAWVQARRANMPPALQARYHVTAYLHEQMPTALQAADLVVARAGASVMGEFPAAGLPAVLVPYPYAGAHQTRNANYLARHNAAVVIDDAVLAHQLADIVIDLLTDREKLLKMGRAATALAQPDAADRLAHQILEVGRYGN